MDYEKKYNEAIKRAKQHCADYVVETIFPELAESEDERIRKEMIFYFQEEIPQCSIQEHSDKMREFISWLKRQEIECIKLELKAGNSYFCYKSRWERADNETFKKGLIYKCNKDGVLDNFVIKNPEQHFIEIKDERIAWLEKQKTIDVLDEEEREFADNVDSYRKEIDAAYQKGFDEGVKTTLEKQGEQKEINLVEILKHYPRETELYSPLYGKLWLAEIDEKCEIITCYKHPLDEGCTRAILEQEDTVSFYSNGTTGLPDFSVSKDCMLFLYDVKKQGEPKPADKVEPKFKVGDFVVNKNGYIRQIIDFKDSVYYCLRQETCDDVSNPFRGTMEYVDTQWHLWTIQDAKDGDVLAYRGGQWIFIFKEIENNNSIIEYHALLSERGLETKNAASTSLISAILPATKEQYDLLFQKMKEAGYTFNFEKKELKKVENEIEIPFGAKDSELQEATYYIPKGFHAEIEGNNVVIKKGEQKHTWTEEDDEHLERILKELENQRQRPLNSPYLDKIESDYNWLKSLKERYTWKPSDEQMSVIEAVINNTSFERRHLNSLYEQLKKLKGE